MPREEQYTRCEQNSIKHQQQLSDQLDTLLLEYEHFLQKNINQWEKQSIANIQTTAETVRQDLREKIEKLKERVSKLSNDISMNLYSSHQVTNHFEEQLKQLELQILSSLSINFNENKYSFNNFHDTENIIEQDKFSKVIGNSIIDNDGFLAKHTNEDWNYEYILGKQFYTQGRHTILFQIEQNGTPYNIFFGCISSQNIQNRISIKSTHTVGWFGYNQIYQYGIHNDNPNLHGYHSTEFAKNDIIHLTFDCDKNQIELYHQDTNKNHILPININKAPLPWQFLIVLTDKDDSIKILPTKQKNFIFIK